MNPDQTAVELFLRETDMHPENIGIEATVNHMLDEMTLGLEGRTSSLDMIPTYIEIDAAIVPDRRVVVLDAGGTNLRAALVSFSADGKPHIEDFTKKPMPGTQGVPISASEFFDSLAALVEPLVGRGSRIGFCFSYPTEITPDRDGRLLYWTKEVKATEVEGALVGSGLKNALRERGHRTPVDVVVLNDTVATVLTGKAARSGRHWGAYTGFILGTGTNTCYIEANRNITKIPGLDPAHSQVINCESGNFALRGRGRADLMLGDLLGDAQTRWLEKALSGRYFGPLATQLIRLACGSGVFSKTCRELLTGIGEVSTRDADNYLHNPADPANPLVSAVRSAGNPADAVRLWYLLDALLERAARITAANLAASVLKGRETEGPLEPVCLSIDGTTYYRYYRFQLRVETHLRPFLSARNRFYETTQVDDAPLIGAAVAALTN